MSVVLDGSTDYLKLSNAVQYVNGGSLFPCTVSCWMKTTDLAQTTALACFDDGSTNQNIAQFRGSVAGDYVAAACYDGAWDLAISTSGVSSGTWHHVLVVFNSTTDRRVYIDGGSKGTDVGTANSGPGGSGDLGVGCRFPDGTPSLFFGGKVAEVAIWDIALADADAVTLSGDTTADTVESGNLLWYWQLYGDANNDGGSRSDVLTEQGTPTYDTEDHPVTVSGTTYVDVAGTVAAAASVAGALTVGTYVGLAGTIAPQIVISGTLTVANFPSGGTAASNSKLSVVAFGNNRLYYEDI